MTCLNTGEFEQFSIQISKMNSLDLVLCRSPLRVSFIGGGTDFPNFYSKHGGTFISATINRYIYTIVKEHSQSFEENYRLNYSETELHKDISEIRNGIVKATLSRYQNQCNDGKSKLYIGTIGDLRSNSGLGSSSAFACSLVKAMAVHQKKSITTEELAKEVIDIELKDLMKPIGIQDQLASAYGGLRKFDIDNQGHVKSRRLFVSEEKQKILNNVLFLIDTKIYRNADDVTIHQQKPNHNQEKILLQYVNEVDKFEKILENHADIDFNCYLGEFLHLQWQEKKKISNAISSTYLDEFYEILLKCGFLGGKLTGAGGGGYFLMIAPFDKIFEIETELNFRKIQFDRPNLSYSGTEVLSSR